MFDAALQASQPKGLATMTIKALMAAGAAAALLATPALAVAQQTKPSKGETQRTESRTGRAAQTSTTNTTGRMNANENAGFGAGMGGQMMEKGQKAEKAQKGQKADKGQKGGDTTSPLREGMQVLDANGNVIGVILQVQRTQDGEIRQIKVRFDQFGRVMIKLVPQFQLKVKGTQALTTLVREQIERLQDA
jgi:hypothetical protein